MMRRIYVCLGQAYHKLKMHRMLRGVGTQGVGVQISDDTKWKNKQAFHFGNDVHIDSGANLLAWVKYTNATPNQKLHPEVVIGDHFHASRNLTIQSAGKTVIGKNVLIGSNVFICDYNHGVSTQYESFLRQPLKCKEVIIGDNVWIGQAVIILPGVHIGNNVIIGAGSIVTHNVADNSIIAGNPAKLIRVLR